MSEHDGHRKRLRARANETGLTGFQPHEVLEMLLTETIPRRDVNPLAHALIDHFGSFSGVLDATKEELMQVDGVGERTADHLTRQPEFYAFYQQDRWREKPELKNVKSAGAYCVTIFGRQQVETTVVLCLDVQCRMIARQTLSTGTITEAPVYPRTVAEIALRHHAHSVILAHNHPSGQLVPSKGDVEVSEQVARALLTLEIRLSDHIIVAGDQSMSMYARGYLKGVHQMTEAAFPTLPKESFPWHQINVKEGNPYDLEQYRY